MPSFELIVIAFIAIGLVCLVTGLMVMITCRSSSVEYISAKAKLYAVFTRDESMLVDPIVEFTDETGELVRRSCQPVREKVISANPGDVVDILYAKKHRLGFTQWSVLLDTGNHPGSKLLSTKKIFGCMLAGVGLIFIIAAVCMAMS